jgi:hypothetical protein
VADDHQIWLTTEPTLDGKSFMVVIEYSKDRSIALGKQSAFEYAHKILTAVQYAEYDAAVFAQMKERLDDDVACAQVVDDLRKSRPEVSFVGFEPFALVPGVSVFTGKPFLTVMLDGKADGQMDLDGAREHALMALEALTVADLDNTYLKVMRDTIGLPEETARAVVANLVRYR